MKRTLAASLIFALVLMSGCGLFGIGGKKNKSKEPEETSEALAYERVQTALEAGNFDVAIQRLEYLETRFPFGRYGEQAQLEIVYAHFMKGDYDAAIVAAERFISLHPVHPKADYAYYLMGMSHFQRDRGYFDRMLGAPEYTKDTTGTQLAFAAFRELVTRFPRSPYAKDAKTRMAYLRNVLAQAEVNVAQYYLTNDIWVAAANRASGVVENYPSTPAVAEALAILVEANYKLGLEDPANDALRVLATNFPDYENFDGEGNLIIREGIRNRDRSWLNVMTFGFLGKPPTPPPIQIKVPAERPEASDE
ncbi:MAG: outer membrane protein assembly factor BamD [Pseudomonadales bacterium]|nr:outer membrane protein assembly factor BamD [Pseudomonadales bacterium]